MTFTEKENKVLQLILAGVIIAAAIAEQSELTVASVNAVVNSLVKKELITKAEDGTLAPTDKSKEHQASQSTSPVISTEVENPEGLIEDKSNAPALEQSRETNTDEETSVTSTTSTVIPTTSPVISTEVENPEGLIEDKSNDPALEQSSEEGHTPKEKETKPITILIPYLKSEAAGEELRYALRTWQDNFKQDFRVIVIGDKEDWFSPDLEHIPLDPHLIKEACACPAPSMIRNPQADITNKLFAAITAEQITGKIIYTNDDIFLLASTQLADLEVLKEHRNDLEKTGEKDSLYAQNNRLTARRLKKENLPIRRYGTHTPIVFIAEKLIDLIEKYDALDHGYPIESIYFNELYPDARPLQLNGGKADPILGSAYRHDIDPKVLKKVFQERKFLNCDTKGWAAVQPLLKEAFPNKSRFEK